MVEESYRRLLSHIESQPSRYTGYRDDAIRLGRSERLAMAEAAYAKAVAFKLKRLIKLAHGSSEFARNPKYGQKRNVFRFCEILIDRVYPN